MKTGKSSTNAAHTSTMETIGRKLAELRLNRGFKTQVEFALANDLPVTQYWRMEKGVANLTFKSLARVLSIHGLTIEELFETILKERKL